MRKTVSGALSVLKMFKTALHGEKVVHIYWHTSAFSLRLRLSHAMHAITSRENHFLGFTWDKALSARSGHCKAMGWRRWDWVGQNGCRPGRGGRRGGGQRGHAPPPPKRPEGGGQHIFWPPPPKHQAGPSKTRRALWARQVERTHLTILAHNMIHLRHKQTLIRPEKGPQGAQKGPLKRWGAFLAPVMRPLRYGVSERLEYGDAMGLVFEKIFIKKVLEPSPLPLSKLSNVKILAQIDR